MDWKLEIIKKEEQKTTIWSGGTTTELAIFPKDASYSERSFIWRLSTARIEAEESSFTLLPGINRVIMILEGEITISHEGHYSKDLKKYEQDTFCGGWSTKSLGKAVDFNLMMAEGAEGELEACHLGKGDSKLVKSIAEESGKKMHGVYCVKGSIMLQLPNGEIAELKEDDMALLTAKRDIKEGYFAVKGIGEGNSDFVLAHINMTEI